MKYLFYVVILLGNNFAFSQVLDNREGKGYTNQPFFNEDFIKTNRIKSVEGIITYKKKGDVLRESNDKHFQRFDRLGKTKYTYSTKESKGKIDTTWHKYSYKLGVLISEKHTDDNGFTRIEYENDARERPIKETFYRDIDSNNRTVRSIKFNEERSKYFDYGTQKLRRRFNNYNLPYLDEFKNYDSSGYLISIEERIKMTSEVISFEYTYNRKGKVASIKKRSSRKKEVLEEIVFEYDALGNLLQKHIYKNGEFVTDIQFVYNSKSKLLSSIIVRQVSTNFLTIVRYKNYSFY